MLFSETVKGQDITNVLSIIVIMIIAIIDRYVSCRNGRPILFKCESTLFFDYILQVMITMMMFSSAAVSQKSHIKLYEWDETLHWGQGLAAKLANGWPWSSDGGEDDNLMLNDTRLYDNNLLF